MIHLVLDTVVVNLLDRIFSDDIMLAPAHKHVASFSLNERIEVRVYADMPMYLAIFFVDGKPVLKELMIEGLIADYADAAFRHPHLTDFVMDYSTPD
jgi:hypothetical protein